MLTSSSETTILGVGISAAVPLSVLNVVSSALAAIAASSPSLPSSLVVTGWYPARIPDDGKVRGNIVAWDLVRRGHLTDVQKQAGDRGNEVPSNKQFQDFEVPRQASLSSFVVGGWWWALAADCGQRTPSCKTLVPTQNGMPRQCVGATKRNKRGKNGSSRRTVSARRCGSSNH